MAICSNYSQCCPILHSPSWELLVGVNGHSGANSVRFMTKIDSASFRKHRVVHWDRAGLNIVLELARSVLNAPPNLASLQLSSPLRHHEIEIAPFIGLQNALVKQLCVTTREIKILWRRTAARLSPRL